MFGDKRRQSPGVNQHHHSVIFREFHRCYLQGTISLEEDVPQLALSQTKSTTSRPSLAPHSALVETYNSIQSPRVPLQMSPMGLSPSSHADVPNMRFEFNLQRVVPEGESAHSWCALGSDKWSNTHIALLGHPCDDYSTWIQAGDTIGSYGV